MSFPVLLVIISLFSCTSKDDSNYEIQDYDYASEWINRVKVPSSSIERFTGEKIDFSIMSCDQKPKYLSRLTDVQFSELNEYEYLTLTGKSLQLKYGLIIRAVYTHGGGNFNVKKNDKNEYYVHYMVMGSRVWEYNKEILIIEADELPVEIYNGYTVVK
jgi:hypothetical protein